MKVFFAQKLDVGSSWAYFCISFILCALKET